MRNDDDIRESAKQKYDYKKNEIDRNKYIKHREEAIQRAKEYYIEYKDETCARRSVRITCECGSVCGKGWMSKHYKSQKHIDYLKSLQTEETPEQ